MCKNNVTETNYDQMNFKLRYRNAPNSILLRRTGAHIGGGGICAISGRAGIYDVGG